MCFVCAGKVLQPVFNTVFSLCNWETNLSWEFQEAPLPKIGITTNKVVIKQSNNQTFPTLNIYTLERWNIHLQNCLNLNAYLGAFRAFAADKEKGFSRVIFLLLSTFRCLNTQNSLNATLECQLKHIALRKLFQLTIYIVLTSWSDNTRNNMLFHSRHAAENIS